MRHAQIADQTAPFAERDGKRIIGRFAALEPITDRLSGFVERGEGTEKPVKDDENRAEVAVEIAIIGGMVNTVVARRVEQPFERAEMDVETGVQEELVDEADERQKENEGARQAAGPAQANGG